jgi:hypothetical protein
LEKGEIIGENNRYLIFSKKLINEGESKMQQVNSTEVQNILRNMRYPASKQQIIDETIKQDTSNEAL